MGIRLQVAWVQMGGRKKIIFGGIDQRKIIYVWGKIDSCIFLSIILGSLV